MRKFSILMVLVVVICMYACNSPSPSQQKKENAPNLNPTQQEFMAKWQAYATPGEAHKELGYFIGSWNYTVSWWMKPDSPPEVSNGTSDVKWIMGGRFVEMNVNGTSMGTPFEGMAIIGYNNFSKQYTNVWIDNMGTGVMTATGSYDKKTKTMIENGTYTCPVEGKKSFRRVTKIVDGDNYLYEFFNSSHDGKEFRAMEIKYTRKK